MGFVFLLARIVFGGWIAWQGAQCLSAYHRPAIVARTGRHPFIVATMGMLAVAGGASIITGVFVPAGVAFVAIAALFAALDDRSAMLRNGVVATTSLLLLAIPRPWPFVFTE